MNLRLHLLLPAIITTVVIALAVHAVVEDAKVRIVVESGRFVFEPAWVRLRVRVEPDAANRGLTVAAVSDGFETSSYEQLDGAHARITRWVTFKDVPSGVYVVYAVVVRAGAGPLRAEETFTVLARY